MKKIIYGERRGMTDKQIKELGEWLNMAILDCVLWLDKNQDSLLAEGKVIWYRGYQNALETTLQKLEQISGLTGGNKAESDI